MRVRLLLFLFLLTGCATTPQRLSLFTHGPAPPEGASETPLFPVGPTKRQVTRSVAASDLARMASVRPGSVVTLALFPDATFTATVEEVVRHGEVIGWRGRLQGAKIWGAASLAVSSHGVMGLVQFDERLFALRPLPSGRTQIAEIAQERFPKGGEPIPRPYPVLAPAAPPAPATGPTALSVMLVLPNLPEYCSVSFLRDLMTSLTTMSLHNVWNAFNDQQVEVERVSLFCPAHVPVGGDLKQDLNWVTNDPDVAAQRVATRSDLVSAVVPSAVFCGRAWVNYPTVSSDAPRAFSVVRFDCLFDDFSLAHEIGHNLGMNHDRFEKGGGTASDCNYGFTVLQNGNPISFTVMAYDDFCESVGFTCGRIGIHSNPEMLTVLDLTIQYGIDCSVMQTGNDGSANNVGQLQKAAPVAAGWQ